jgi:hypothetical protein
MLKFEVGSFVLLTERLDELTTICRAAGSVSEKECKAPLDQYEPGFEVAPYLFLFTTRN